MNEILIDGYTYSEIVMQKIQLLLHLIVPTLQGLHRDQEELGVGGQVFNRRTGEGHGREEVYQPTRFREVAQQEYQGFPDTISIRSCSKSSRLLKEFI